MIPELGRKGFTLGWHYEIDALDKQGPDFQVVYDDDGRYFKVIDQPSNLVLVAIRRA
jgi:hypothetical protein